MVNNKGVSHPNLLDTQVNNLISQNMSLNNLKGEFSSFFVENEIYNCHKGREDNLKLSSLS